MMAILCVIPLLWISSIFNPNQTSSVAGLWRMPTRGKRLRHCMSRERRLSLWTLLRIYLATDAFSSRTCFVTFPRSISSPQSSLAIRSWAFAWTAGQRFKKQSFASPAWDVGVSRLYWATRKRPSWGTMAVNTRMSSPLSISWRKTAWNGLSWWRNRRCWFQCAFRWGCWLWIFLFVSCWKNLLIITLCNIVEHGGRAIESKERQRYQQY